MASSHSSSPNQSSENDEKHPLASQPNAHRDANTTGEQTDQLKTAQTGTSTGSMRGPEAGHSGQQSTSSGSGAGYGGSPEDAGMMNSDGNHAGTGQSQSGHTTGAGTAAGRTSDSGHRGTQGIGGGGGTQSSSRDDDATDGNATGQRM